MFRIKAVVCLLFMTVMAQAQSDLELVFAADDFVGGLAVNQTGVIRFTVTNNGPDDFFASQGAITIGGSYDRNVSESPIQYFSAFTSNDPDCSLIAVSVDPPPPFVPFVPVFYGTIQKTIAAQSSVSCEFRTSIQYVDTVEILWRITPPETIIDPNMDNNSQQFTFRGLAVSVPVNNRIMMLMLLIAVLLMSTWRHRLIK
ncbi:MAG: hypothetical protein DWP95_05455 [Proteobacteria bacterium]|nr:MAG: hypothetical protein DWP95_05455 [Pseudomonadota bacterium]